MRLRDFLVILVVLIVITFPYLYAARSVGPDHVFGGFLFNPIDGNSYLAKMYQGWRGDWCFSLAFTAQPGEGAYLFLFYIFLGHVARIFGLPLVLTYHLARLLGAIVMLVILYHFLVAFRFDAPGLEWIYPLVVFGSGMGWLVFPWGLITADFWVAEAYPFLSAYVNPHFVLGLGLLLCLLNLPEMDNRGMSLKPGMRMEWLAGVGALLLALMLPFGVVVALVILGGLLAWELGIAFIGARGNRGKGWWEGLKWLQDLLGRGRSGFIARRSLWVLLGGAPLLLYDFWVTQVNPVLGVWNAQNLTLTPPVWDLLLSMSPALIFALPGAWYVLRRERRAGLLLVWTLVGLTLVYLPFSLQRRFMMGLFVPIVGLAGFGFGKLNTAFGKRSGLFMALVLAFSMLTNLLILALALFGIRTRDPMLYMTRGEAQALAWIEENTPQHALILAAPETGMFIPAHTGRRVIYGHPFETVNAEAENAAVLKFFQAGSTDAVLASEFLHERHVDYVFYGPRERLLGELPDMEDLDLAYSGEGVVIYRLVED